MNLLIVGAGGHGKVVAEVASDCGFDKIAFLDDSGLEAIGKLDELEKFSEQYEYGFVSIGNNKFRSELIERLAKAGYQIPILIHPTAYVSKSAKIAKGTVIEPKAIVNANAVISTGCIISVGAIVDHDATVGKYSHVNAGAIVKSGVEVLDFIKLEPGQVVFDK